MDCLDAKEQAMIDEALELIRKLDPTAAEGLTHQLGRLQEVAAVASHFPSLLGDAWLGPLRRSTKTLVDTLCQADNELGALNMPVRAVMGEAFLIVKIQLFRAFRLCLRHYADRLPQALIDRATQEVAQSIYTMLLAELLWDLVRSPDIQLETRQRAATELVRLWESPDRLEVDDFFPVLEASWRARSRVKVTFGALVGAIEFFRLIREDCPPLFASFFMREDVSAAENAAFQEFLFGLTQDELQQLRETMNLKGLYTADREFVTATLGWPIPPSLQEDDPETIYYSYRKRQRAAQLRRLTAAPGPRRTAEAYLILHLLEHPALREPIARASIEPEEPATPVKPARKETEPRARAGEPARPGRRTGGRRRNGEEKPAPIDV